MPSRVGAVAALLTMAAIGVWPRIATAQQQPGEGLMAAEVAFGHVDFEATRTAARAALEAGGHTPAEVARIWYLLGVANTALRDQVTARDAFSHMIALAPGQDIG